MLGVGFEPTHLSIDDLKSSPLDHSGIPAHKKFKNSMELLEKVNSNNLKFWSIWSTLNSFVPFPLPK